MKFGLNVKGIILLCVVCVCVCRIWRGRKRINHLKNKNANSVKSNPRSKEKHCMDEDLSSSSSNKQVVS
ncbi:hypothetical protein HanRHA438_Chr01g0015421 [Helianthus annuus]|nr:hypothetical protein HanRHA438_Chr01g0015421 [Helianthus annuus]